MNITLKSKTVTIRKERQCWSCYRKFTAGTKMNYWAGVYEGDFHSNYSCLTCVQVMNASTETEFPEGFVAEMLNNGETPEEMLLRWKTEALD